MDQRAELLASLFERSMGLGPEWRVEDVWFEPGAAGEADELHVRVGRVRGATWTYGSTRQSCAARCPVWTAPRTAS